jgi:signal transduction histidine kinase/ActR/RegA family two-component response regulator
MRGVPILALLFVGYFVAAKVGLSFASIHPSATAIWPPTGIALAAFLLFGRRVWPAIFAGAFLANVTTAGSAFTAAAIAAGNLLEALSAAYLVERFAGGRHVFDRPPDIFRFVLLAAMASTTISATIGVTALALGGYAAWSEYGPIWLTWWLGDAAGALLITPLLLTWTQNRVVAWTRRQWVERLVLLAVLAGLAAAVFGGGYPPTRSYPLAFVCIPPLVWTAFRFGQRETAIAVLVVLWIATWGTLANTGPFSTPPPFARLLILQAFMGTMAAMAMSIAALVAEQKRILEAAQLARAEAESANRAKDDFLAMLGHELRNPLSAITTAVYVLDKTASLDAKAARVRDVIAGQVGQLARLVDDLLDVTRITAGKITLRLKRVDLSLVVSNALDAVQSTGMTAGYRVAFRGSPTWVNVDEARVQQMLHNLISNAIKFTPSGGEVHVTVSTEDGKAVLRVEDTGIGISADLLPRVFDLFTQGDRGLDRAQGGLGLGLTIVKRLAELHGGSVEAASAGAGRGTVFTVRLPAVTRAPATERVSPPAAPTRRRRVLLAEDQPDAREMLSVALRSAGHDVFDAADGPGAVAEAARCHPEVAIIDIGLPGYDGYEVARTVRRADGGEAMYLIALTGYGQPEDKQRAEAAGFDLHIVKPVDPAHLNRLIANAVRSRSR